MLGKANLLLIERREKGADLMHAWLQSLQHFPHGVVLFFVDPELLEKCHMTAVIVFEELQLLPNIMCHILVEREVSFESLIELKIERIHTDSNKSAFHSSVL
jgi:hypothetical protein